MTSNRMNSVTGIDENTDIVVIDPATGLQLHRITLNPSVRPDNPTRHFSQSILFGPNGKLFIPYRDLSLNDGVSTGCVMTYDPATGQRSVFVVPSLFDSPLTSCSESDSLDEQLCTLLGAVDRLQADVSQLRSENEVLREQVSMLRCDAGYWKSRHTDRVKRNELLHSELIHAKGEILLLKADRFGESPEKQWDVDRSGEMDDRDQPAKKNKRGP